MASKPPPKPDDLTISVGGSDISGWETIEVTLRAEGFPNSFAISMSAKGRLVAKAGDPCSVSLGSDRVITGYIDRDGNGGNADSHVIRLVGRGKTCDLVDCSGEWPSGQMIAGDALTIARNLAKPYGITVELGPGAKAGPKVDAWALNYGDTGADIIQRVARNAGLMAYEDSRGVLILGTVGSKTAASGVVYGANVEEWDVENSMDGRYSAIVCCSEALDAFQELPGSDFYDQATDPGVPRHRVLYTVVEQVAVKPQEFTSLKAIWDAARRAGRATPVRATVSGWRDSGGALWAPNTLIPVDLPGNRAGKTLCLSEVTFRRSDAGGTTAEMLLMPPSAFVPEPIVLQQVATADLTQPTS